MSRFYKISILAFGLAGFYLISTALLTHAVPPTPGFGSGAIATDAAGNIAIGTSTTKKETKLLIVASSTDAINYALKIIQPNGAPILFVRNDGRVSIGTSSLSSTLTVGGSIYSTDNFIGTIAAANVTPGVFNGATGGNYAFNGGLGVGTTTQVSLPAKLAVYGGSNTSQLVIFANSSQSPSNPIIQLRASDGSAILGIHADSNGSLFVGNNAGISATNNGSDNVALGNNALRSLTDGSFNVAVGSGALYSNTLGPNVAVGQEALYFNTNGTYNTALGYKTLYFNTGGGDNTAVGRQALYSSNGSQNVAVGSFALYSGSGNRNVAIGFNALFNFNAADDNVVVGHNAMYSSSPGSGNVALGNSALGGGGGENNNVAIGFVAGGQSQGGSNVFIGYQAGASNLEGDSNVFLGTNAGYHEIGSNKLYIESNQIAAGQALIYGDFATRQIAINTTTLSSATFTVAGDVYATGNITCGGTCGASGGKDISSFRQVGTSPIERWYGNLHIQTNTYSTGAPVVGTLYAYPFVSGRGGTLDRIQFNVTTGGAAGSVARVGIYTSTSDTNLYPNTLVVDGGQFDTTTTGTKTATISTTLTGNKLYWLVYLAGTAAPTVRAGQVTSMPNILGMDSSMGTSNGIGLTVSQSYGALPGTFPAGAAVQTSTPIPIITVRYSN